MLWQDYLMGRERRRKPQSATLLFQLCTYQLLEAGSSWIKQGTKGRKKNVLLKLEIHMLYDIMVWSREQRTETNDLKVGWSNLTIRKWTEDRDLVYRELDRVRESCKEQINEIRNEWGKVVQAQSDTNRKVLELCVVGSAAKKWKDFTFSFS